MDPAGEWAPAGIRLTVAAADPPGADDPSRVWRGESGRALELSERGAA